jgi:peptidyl-prolyl cis-trans isomerase C
MLVVCAHAAWAQQPIPSHTTGGSSTPKVAVVARVNAVAITSDRLDVALGRRLPMESFHRSVSAETVQRLRQESLDELITEELRHQEGLRLHLTPSDAEVNAGLARAVAGYKSRDAFDQAMRRSGASMSEVLQEIRRALVIRNAYQRAVGSQCQASAEEAAAFFAANPDRFMVPERLHVYVLTIGVDPGAPARQWADAKARAEDVARQISQGAPFEDMARKYSTDPARAAGGDMGFVHRGSLADEIEQALRGLQPGAVSAVVQTLYGFHLVRVTAIQPPERSAFSAVGAGIQKDLTRKRCAEMDAAWTARLRAAASIELTPAAGGTVSRPAGAARARQ